MHANQNTRGTFLFILLCAFPLFTASAFTEAGLSNFATQDELITHVEVLRKDQGTNPLEASKTAASLISISQQNEWPVGYLYTSAYKLESDIKQENISSANKIYEEILADVNTLNHPVLTSRLMMANLKIKFALGQIEVLPALYGPLQQRAKESKNQSEIGEIHLSLGLSQQSTSKLAEAIKSYNLAYETFDKLNEPISTALVLNSLADAYNNLGDTQLAIEYFKLALDLHKTLDDKFGQSVVLYNLGRVYTKASELNLAQSALTDALNISVDIDDAIGIAWAQSALAKVALGNENWAVALDLSQKAEAVFKDVGDKQSQFDTILFKAKAYLGTGDIINAERKLMDSKNLLPTSTKVTAFFEYHNTNANIAIAKGEFERAIASINIKYEWMTEKHKRNREKQVTRYKVEFDSQLKDKQNEILQKDIELKQLKIFEQQGEKRIWLLGITLSVLFLIFLLTLLFLQIRNRNRFKVLAFRDHLTNSPNRRAILLHAETKLAEAKHSGMSLILGIVDLDSFKKLNDSFGHDTGDEVLKNFALACTSALRKQDRFGRYGGEEWLLVFVDTETSKLNMIFERITDHLNKLPAKGLPNNHKVTFSMGLAKYDPGQHKTISALIKEADDKLYLAKENGRNCIEY